MSSCCSKSVDSCTVLTAFKQGCVSALTSFLNSNIKIIGIIAIVFAVVEVSISKNITLSKFTFIYTGCLTMS